MATLGTTFSFQNTWIQFADSAQKPLRTLHGAEFSMVFIQYQLPCHSRICKALCKGAIWLILKSLVALLFYIPGLSGRMKRICPQGACRSVARYACVLVSFSHVSLLHFGDFAKLLFNLATGDWYVGWAFS